jgi:hypothetical protein
MSIPQEIQNRNDLASEVGYLDAKFMRFMHETYGLHIADQVVATNGRLKIPWMGLRHEFLTMGMKESAVDSMLNEAKEFEVAHA